MVRSQPRPSAIITKTLGVLSRRTVSWGASGHPLTRLVPAGHEDGCLHQEHPSVTRD